jgi:hypothetical protein
MRPLITAFAFATVLAPGAQAANFFDGFDGTGGPNGSNWEVASWGNGSPFGCTFAFSEVWLSGSSNLVLNVNSSQPSARKCAEIRTWQSFTYGKFVVRMQPGTIAGHRVQQRRSHPAHQRVECGRPELPAIRRDHGLAQHRVRVAADLCPLVQHCQQWNRNGIPPREHQHLHADATDAEPLGWRQFHQREELRGPVQRRRRRSVLRLGQGQRLNLPNSGGPGSHLGEGGCATAAFPGSFGSNAGCNARPDAASQCRPGGMTDPAVLLPQRAAVAAQVSRCRRTAVTAKSSLWHESPGNLK